MFIIDFEWYDKETGTYIKDSFECEKTFNEFKMFISDNDILNYEIINITIG